MNKPCGHPDNNNRHTCPHVRPYMEDGVKRFTGTGTQYLLLCPTCAKKPLYALKPRCGQCLRAIEDEVCWQIEGAPGVVAAHRPFQFFHAEYHLPGPATENILAVAPFHDNADWLAFTAAGDLLRLNFEAGRVDTVARIGEAAFNLAGAIQLVISRDAAFAAITTRVYQRELPPESKGVVVSLGDGSITMRLQRGDYHTELSDFPVAFVTRRHETLLIHASDWQRLDISDPATGHCLTQRDYEKRPPDWEKNPQAFSEWSGELYVSPQQTWIADNGWAWHPVGLVSTWSLQHWLENKWESDFGASKRQLVSRPYFWHGPMCWIDEHTLAIWGNEELMDENDIPQDSVAFYDVRSGQLLHWFAGPTMDFFQYDSFLFTGDHKDRSLSVWDIDAGCRIHVEREFFPYAYHPWQQTFLTITGSGGFRLSHWRDGPP